MPQITVVLSDESVNDYGFRVLTGGIDTSLFEKNPVMLYNHHRSNTYGNDKLLPIGKWTNIRKEGGRLLATPEFDEDDEFAVKVKSKFEKGILNAASIGFSFIATSEDPAVMLPGQTRPTVTQSKIKEASIADIPGNANCHKLSYKGTTLMLSADTAPGELDNILPILSQKEEKMNNEDLKLVAETLGMKDASVAQIMAKVTEDQNRLTQLTSENTSLKQELETLKAQSTTDKVNELVTGALAGGKITEAQKAIWVKLATDNYESAKAALDSMQKYEPITPKLSVQNGDNSDAALAARYDELDKEGKLASLDVEERNLLVEAKTRQLRASGKAK